MAKVILLKIKNQEKIEWPQIAYEFGYADQSHFIKEFKAFSGFNPQEFNGQQQLLIGSGLNKPEHLAINAQGDIFVSNAGNGEIRRFDSNGVALGIFVAAGSFVSFVRFCLLN